MKIWIVYDSKFGSNVKIATYMQQLLSDEHDIHVNYAKDIEAKDVVAESPDVLIFGGPLRIGNLSYTIRKWAKKFGKHAKKQGLTLKKLAAWETKSYVTDEDKMNAEGMEKKLMDKMENTPEVLKELMNDIPVKSAPIEPLSIYIIMPPNDEMSQGTIEDGFEEKVRGFLSNIFD